MVKIELNDFGLGFLMLKKNKENITYQPFEISRYGLGIITDQPLDVGSDLVLKSAVGEIPFRVSSQIFGMDGEELRYRLVALDMEADIEQFILDISTNEKVASLALSRNLQFARFETEPPIPVLAKTFGSTNRYQFKTINASASGLLIAGNDDKIAPFNVNTLLEIEMFPNGAWLNEPLNCLAKVARRNSLTRPGQPPVLLFGIHFLEFQKQDMKTWQQVLKDIERELLMKGDQKHLSSFHNVS